MSLNVYFRNGTKKLFGLLSYQSRGCGAELGWWNPAPIMKFITDNTDYENPTLSGSSEGATQPTESKPSTRPALKSTTSVVKTTNKPTTVKTKQYSDDFLKPGSVEQELQAQKKPEVVSLKWSKQNKTTTDPTCDEFCRHRHQMCTFVSVNPPLFGCQTVVNGDGTPLLTPNFGVHNSESSTKRTENNNSKTSAPKSNSTPSSETKTWTKENYKTASPNCHDYCTKKNMRCSFVTDHHLLLLTALGCSI